MFTVREARQFYFDRPGIEARMDRATLRALSRFGAFVRTGSISSILRHVVRRGFGVKTKVKNRDGISPEGQPPFSHTGDVAKRISFVYDPAQRSVIIGPEKFSKPGDGKALEVLEAGGKETLPAWKKRAAKVANYRARPFMKPAFDTELKKMPADWRDSLNRS